MTARETNPRQTGPAARRAFIGKVAGAAGISVHGVRYYERLGLLPPPHRTAAGYRVYSADAPERLRFIRQAQALGFTLAEIKEILRLRFAGQSPCECVRGMLEKKLEQVKHQMAGLAKFRRQLHRVLARSQDLRHLPHTASTLCPIIQIHSLRRKAMKADDGQRGGQRPSRPGQLAAPRTRL
jgi:DNA-binding transcriptional MerR regulator